MMSRAILHLYLCENVRLCGIPARAPAAETRKKCQFVGNDRVSFARVSERYGSYSVRSAEAGRVRCEGTARRAYAAPYAFASVGHVPAGT